MSVGRYVQDIGISLGHPLSSKRRPWDVLWKTRCPPRLHPQDIPTGYPRISYGHPRDHVRIIAHSTMQSNGCPYDVLYGILGYPVTSTGRHRDIQMSAPFTFLGYPAMTCGTSSLLPPKGNFTFDLCDVSSLRKSKISLWRDRIIYFSQLVLLA